MGGIRTNGIDALYSDLSMISLYHDSVMEDILNAEADVIVSQQRAEIERQWKGPYSLGISAKSVKKGLVKWGTGRRIIFIYPRGTRKRGKKTIRNAEIAFINEFGAPKRNIRARPAIRDANEDAIDEATAAGEKVYNDFLNRMNL